MEEFNPYAAPKAEVITQNSEAEVIRRAHINHEASIKSVGCLYAVGALALGSVVVFSLLNSARGDFSLNLWLPLGLAVLTGAMAWGLRKLQRWAGILVAIWAGAALVFGLVNLPSSIIGMLISGYFVYIMIGAKGRMVMSPEYKAIIAQTPHVKRKTSALVWVLLVLLLAILAIGIFSAMNS